MRISGLVVSVDYAPQLSQAINLWRDGLDDFLVVTAPRDLATKSVCDRAKVPYVETDAFYTGGAYFNKAAGMMDAVPRMAWDDWILLLDADVVPPTDWRTRVENHDPRPGTLYGAWRNDEDGHSVSFSSPFIPRFFSRYRLDMMCGFFHLFHVSDPNAPRRWLLDTIWQTAAWYDTEFEVRWDRRKERIHRLVLQHLGKIGRNWCGVGNERILRRVMKQPMPMHRVQTRA